MKQTIGRKDKADFPALDLIDLEVKIDTGAYGASIHCQDIKEVKQGDRSQLHFKLLDPSHPQYQDREFVSEDFSIKDVKNSFGQTEKRYVIKTTICLFEEVIETDFSLSERAEMKSPVLLGRKLLNGKFIVDPARYNLSYKAKKRALRASKD